MSFQQKYSVHVILLFDSCIYDRKIKWEKTEQNQGKTGKSCELKGLPR